MPGPRSRGIHLVPILLVVTFAARADHEGFPPERPDGPSSACAAVEKGIRRIHKGAAAYPQSSTCFTCHHHTMPLVTWQKAVGAGVLSGKTVAREKNLLTRTLLEELGNDRSRANLREGGPLPGDTATVTSALQGLKAAGHPPDEVTGALVEYLLKKQKADGSWEHLTKSRPPSEGSSYTATAAAVAGLDHYGLPDRTTSPRVREAVARALRWLQSPTPPPADTEDTVFLVKGLAAAGDGKGAAAAARSLAHAQGPDGGWSQRKGERSDAYATASALTALAEAGIGPEDPAYRKGVDFLLKTQRPDGGWWVETRAEQIQALFLVEDPPEEGLSEADLALARPLERRFRRRTGLAELREAVTPAHPQWEAVQAHRRIHSQFLSFHTSNLAVQALLPACRP